MRAIFHICLIIIGILIVSCSGSAVKMNPVIHGDFRPSGGRAVAVTTDPVYGKVVWVATPTGGLYQSPDNGNTWSKVDAMPEFGCFDIKFSPNREHANIIIATCLEDLKTRNAGGIWLSSDAGNTWSQPPSGKVHNSKKSYRRYGAYGISFMPYSQTVVVGTDSGLAVSKDLGTTWAYINPPGDNKPNPFYSVLALRDNRIICAGDSGVWISDNTQTMWKKSKDDLVNDNRVKNALAAGEVDPNIFGSYEFFFAGDSRHKLLHSGDGINWTDVAADFTIFPKNNGNHWRQPYVELVPSMSNNPWEWDLYFTDIGVVAKKRIRWNPVTGVFDFSIDSWKQLMFQHADPADIVFASDGTHRPLYAVNDGGVERTGDGGLTWEQVGNVNNLFNAYQVYDVKAIPPPKGSVTGTSIYFGTQDNSQFGSPDGGNNWTWFYGDEGGNFQADLLLRPQSVRSNTLTLYDGLSASFFRCNPSLTGCSPVDIPFKFRPKLTAIYVSGDNKYMVLGAASDNQVKLFTSTDGFMTWTSTTPLISVDQSLLLFAFISGQTNPSVYAAFLGSPDLVVSFGPPPKWGIMRIDNAFNNITGDESWQLINLPTDCSLGIYGFQYRESIASFGSDPADASFLIVPDIHNNKIWITENGGGNWTDRQDLADIITDHGKYVLNLGGSSNRIFFELSISQVSSICFDPANHNCILIGTAEAGVVLSTDHGATWKKIEGSERIPNVTSFSFGTGVAYASSWGGGLWEIPLN
jgi:photosystem II stability/assembly factor-like uncharacterized protein